MLLHLLDLKEIDGFGVINIDMTDPHTDGTRLFGSIVFQSPKILSAGWSLRRIGNKNASGTGNS